jgi:hypothetical protein
MNKQNYRRIILVIGIQRSGTSALTKALITAGVSLPVISSIVVDSYNEKGYWEDADIHDLNQKMLHELSVKKKCCRSFIPITEEEKEILCHEGFLTQASELLSKKNFTSQPIAIKDPLTTLLLPFWKQVFEQSNIITSFVITLRNPMSVVASLSRFTDQSSEESCWKFFCVWISFMLSCIEHSQGYPSIIVDYQELLKDPAIQMQRVAHALKLEIDHDLLKDYRENFIDPALCHFKSDSSIPNSHSPLQEDEESYLYPDALRNFSIEMYQYLFAAAQDQISFSQLKEALEPWKKEFSLVKPLLCLAEKNQWDIDHLKDQLIRQESERNKATTENLMIKTQLSLKLHQSHVKDLIVVNKLWNHNRHE